MTDDQTARVEEIKKRLKEAGFQPSWDSVMTWCARDDIAFLLTLIDAKQPSPEKIAEWLTGWKQKRFDLYRADVGWRDDYVLEMLTDFARDFRLEAEEERMAFKCKANRTADPSQDCDWPRCGCDPYAEKVIAALEESGGALTERDTAIRAEALREAAKHYPTFTTDGADELVKGYGICSCGAAKADGVTPYNIIWNQHILSLIPQGAPHVPVAEKPQAEAPAEATPAEEREIKLRKALNGILEMAGEEIRTGTYVPGSFIHQIEADAYAAIEELAPLRKHISTPAEPPTPSVAEIERKARLAETKSLATEISKRIADREPSSGAWHEQLYVVQQVFIKRIAALQQGEQGK